MKKRDWSDCKLTIGCPGDEDSIIIPIHGEKETDINNGCPIKERIPVAVSYFFTGPVLLRMISSGCIVTEVRSVEGVCMDWSRMSTQRSAIWLMG